MKFIPWVILVVAVGLFIAFRPEPVEDPRIKIYQDSTAYFKKKADSSQTQADRWQDSVTKERKLRLSASAARQRAESELNATLETSERVLNDMNASADELRLSLRKTVVSVRIYQDSLIQERLRFERENALQANEIIDLRLTVKAKDQQLIMTEKELKVWKEKNDCSVLGINCPSRLQSAALGSGITTILILLFVL